MSMRRSHRTSLSFLFALLSVSVSLGQVPTARLQVTKSSGFLGMGSPHFVTVRLSTPRGDTILTSETVNAHALYYFLLKPEGDWLPDEDFRTSLAPTLRILQGDVRFDLATMDEATAGDSSLILGFPKDLRLSVPFQFSIGTEDEIYSAPFDVPTNFWPGYARLETLLTAAQESRRAGKHRLAVASIDSALMDPSLQEFPQLTDLREARTTLVTTVATNAWARLDSALASPQMSLEQKITVADSAASDLRFAADSLQASSLGIRSAEPAIVDFAARTRAQAAQSVSLRNSLQEQLDLEQIAWILQRGNHAKNGLLYDHMVEALAYAYSSVNFLDTSQASFTPALPSQIKERLDDEGIAGDYAVFVRMCNDRYRRGDLVFPDGFLPTLRADTARQMLPAYFMLQAFSDYWSGRANDARAAARVVVRRSTDPLIVSRYDMLRVATGIRLGEYPSDEAATLAKAQSLIVRGDVDSAVELLSHDRGPTALAALALMGGNLAVSRGDTVGALDHFAAALRTDPLTVDAALSSAGIWRARGELRGATDILQRAVEQGNEYWLVYYTLGMISLEDNRPPGALSALEAAQSITPRNYETAIALGLTHEKMGDVRRARDYYNRAISIDPLRTEAVDLLTKLKRINRPSR